MSWVSKPSFLTQRRLQRYHSDPPLKKAEKILRFLKEWNAYNNIFEECEHSLSFSFCIAVFKIEILAGGHSYQNYIISWSIKKMQYTVVHRWQGIPLILRWNIPNKRREIYCHCWPLGWQHTNDILPRGKFMERFVKIH